MYAIYPRISRARAREGIHRRIRGGRGLGGGSVLVDPYQKGGGASGTFRSPDSLSGLFVSGASTIGEKNFIYEQMLPIIVAKNRRRALSDRQGINAAIKGRSISRRKCLFFLLPLILLFLRQVRVESIRLFFRLVNLIVLKLENYIYIYFSSPFAMNKRS